MLTKHQYIKVLHFLWYAGLLVVICVILVYAMFGGGELPEKVVERRIEQANYCSVTSDCVVLPGKCPFGCYVLANRSEAPGIKRLMESHISSCVYSCAPQPEYTCRESRCVWVEE